MEKVRENANLNLPIAVRVLSTVCVVLVHISNFMEIIVGKLIAKQVKVKCRIPVPCCRYGNVAS